jgi:hypothetical protein
MENVCGVYECVCLCIWPDNSCCTIRQQTYPVGCSCSQTVMATEHYRPRRDTRDWERENIGAGRGVGVRDHLSNWNSALTSYSCHFTHGKAEYIPLHPEQRKKKRERERQMRWRNKETEPSSFSLFGLWGYWHWDHSWPIVPASGDSEDDCGEADGI